MAFMRRGHGLCLAIFGRYIRADFDTLCSQNGKFARKKRTGIFYIGLFLLINFPMPFRYSSRMRSQVVLQKRQQEAAKRHREYEQKMSREIQVMMGYARRPEMVYEGGLNRDQG